MDALNEIAKEIPIVLPLHPRTYKIIKSSKLKMNKIMFIDPVGYLEMVYLLKHCNLVMTDSGGLQKEAFFFGKPCITLRDETEWVELVDNGFNILVGAKKEKILHAYYNQNFRIDFNINLYGNGNASNRIVNSLIKFNS